MKVKVVKFTKRVHQWEYPTDKVLEGFREYIISITDSFNDDYFEDEARIDMDYDENQIQGIKDKLNSLGRKWVIEYLDNSDTPVPPGESASRIRIIIYKN